MKLDRKEFETKKCVSIGKIPAHIRLLLAEKAPFIDLPDDEDIVFWKDRISHTDAHRGDFISDSFYEQCFEDIPEFIESPDYISVKSNGSSISFIRILSQKVAVVVRISTSGKLSYRTMYPILSAQLENYMKKGHAWRI